MRRLRRLVIVLAAVIGAFWLLGDRLDLQQHGRNIALPRPDKSIPELTGRGAEDLEPPGPRQWATPSDEQLKAGPPRDVSEEQREELVAYLHERWPQIMTEYDFQGVRLASWDPGNDGYVGYFAEFGTEKRVSPYRRRKPVIGCGFTFERASWHCFSPVFEAYFDWPDQPEPVLVDGEISDDLAYLTMAVFAAEEGRNGGIIESLIIDQSGPDIMRIGIRQPAEAGGGTVYRYYRFTPSDVTGFDFEPLGRNGGQG